MIEKDSSVVFWPSLFAVSSLNDPGGAIQTVLAEMIECNVSGKASIGRCTVMNLGKALMQGSGECAMLTGTPCSNLSFNKEVKLTGKFVHVEEEDEVAGEEEVTDSCKRYVLL